MLEALAGLIDKSLVKVESSEPARYRLAETVGLYGLERLRDAGELKAAFDGRDAALCRLAAAERPELAEAKLLERYGPDYGAWSQVFDRAVERRDAEVAAATVRVLRLLDQARGGELDAAQAAAAEALRMEDPNWPP